MHNMDEKKIQLLALSAIRWPSHGVFQVGDSTFFGILVFMNIRSPMFHKKGVTIVPSFNANAAWRAAGSDFDPICMHLLQIRLKMHS